MNRKPILIVGLLALALGLVIGTAWQNRQSSSALNNENHSSNERTYVMNVAISSMPFWTEPKHTWEQIGQVTPGLRTSFGGPSSSDTSKQSADIETLLSQKIDGLVVFSTDPNALIPTINKAVDQGVPVVTVFADVPKSKRLAYVGANQVESAKAVARQVIQDYPNRIKPDTKALIVMGKIGAEDQDDRRKGFEEEIGKKMKLVTPAVDDYKPDQATAVIRAALNRNPDIKFIFGCDSQSAIGAIAALKELKKQPGDVIVTAWDSEPVVMNEIKANEGHIGWVHATAVLYSSYMVETAFSFLEAHHFGYLYSGSTTGTKTPAAPQVIEVPIKIVTERNIEEFLANQVKSK